MVIDKGLTSFAARRLKGGLQAFDGVRFGGAATGAVCGRVPVKFQDFAHKLGPAASRLAVLLRGTVFL